MRTISTKLYIAAFIITLCVFSVALYGSNYINNWKTNELKATEHRIALDILSLETQFDLLKESSCKTYDKSVIKNQLDSLAARLNFLEQQVGPDDPEVIRLKQYYYVLGIQDYLLNKKMAEQCKQQAVFILYFYSTTDCEECLTQDYMLRAIRDQYPQYVSVYSFDYNSIELPALQTLVSLHNIPKNPPILDINGKLYGPFKSLEQLKAIITPLIASSTTLKSTR